MTNIMTWPASGDGQVKEDCDMYHARIHMSMRAVVCGLISGYESAYIHFLASLIRSFLGRDRM